MQNSNNSLCILCYFSFLLFHKKRIIKNQDNFYGLGKPYSPNNHIEKAIYFLLVSIYFCRLKKLKEQTDDKCKKYNTRLR